MSLQPMFLLSELLANLPVILVWLVGIVFALRMRGNNRRAGMYALVGLVLLLILSFLNLFSGYLPLLVHAQTGMGMNTLGMLNFAVKVFLSLLTAGAWALILLAIFSGRAQMGEKVPPSAP